jgi:hypothetical protein
MKLEPFQLPSPPPISESEWDDACRTKNFNPILFEMYKHVGIIGVTCIQLQPDSPDIRDLPPRHWALLISLLNRCCRLILSNIALSHDGLHAETLRILERCITESAINVLWLCRKDDPGLYDRFLADGTKNDLEMRNLIQQNIHERQGRSLVIEERMLRSIDRLVRSTGLTSEEIENTPRLPNFKQRLEALEFDEQHYLVFQKMGSHSIHGTWPDLLKYYLEWDEDKRFAPSDHDARPHENQYIFICFLVLNAIRCFLKYIMDPKFNVDDCFPQLKETHDLLRKINTSLCEGDFE